MPDLKQAVFRNITPEELERFWEHLGPEKRYLTNPLQSNLVFVSGIRHGQDIAAITGLRRYCGILLFTFSIVKDEYQGQGFGFRSNNEMFKYARSQSYPIIFASANRGNAASVKLLYKAGYKLLYQSDAYCRFGVAFNTLGKLALVLMPLFFRFYSLYEKLLAKGHHIDSPRAFHPFKP